MGKDKKGLTVGKEENFSEWFPQLMLKADLADYSAVSGMTVYKPSAYAIWENLVSEVDKRFKKLGVKNVYFPMFIPEKLLSKETEHIEGFAPEVAWVTHAGKTKLNERFAVRPTSEAIMYDSYSKWIRSWRDLPLKYNQWNNVVRWEFKHPVPFLRGREFLWNEGHSAYADKKEAEKEEGKIMSIYKEVCENYLALPGLVGRKSDKEKFAGAEYTVSLEYLMPNGKAIQGPDFHFDGQKFAKVYDIKFLDKDEKKKYVYQNTYAITTRMLGVMFAIHSDDKGLVLPPNIINEKIAIVPILFEDTKDKVLEKAREIGRKLKKYGAWVDDRDYSPGWKFNEWEMKGIPVRIEIGPRDLKKKEVIVSRRDTNEKKNVKIKDLDKFVKSLLEDIQKNLFERAKKKLYDNIVEVNDLKGLEKALKNKKIALTPLCKEKKIDEKLKTKTGAKVLNIPINQPNKKGKCVISGKEADYWAYTGKSY